MGSYFLIQLVNIYGAAPLRKSTNNSLQDYYGAAILKKTFQAL